MNIQEEEQIFNMAKQDIPFLKNLKLDKHDDCPDFVLMDKDSRKIGLEHFRADVYRVQDENSSHISGGHTVLNKVQDEIYQEYHSTTVNNGWNDEIMENASNEIYNKAIKNALDMRSDYKHEEFIDNIHVGIHGKLPKIKGHIQKSKNYPDRESYDLMGFLIGIPVPSFRYCFETTKSQKISHNCNKIPRRYNSIYSNQKINGLPITNEIWKKLNIFKDIDFIIIETYNANNLQEHYGQYFDKNTPKPHIYPAFSFGLTDMNFTDVSVERKNGEINAMFKSQINHSKTDVVISKTLLKTERRK